MTTTMMGKIKSRVRKKNQMVPVSTYANMPITHRRTHRYHRCDTWFLTSDSAVDYSPVPANQCHSDTCSHFRLRGSRTCRARYSLGRSSGRLKHKDKNAVFFFESANVEWL